MAKSWVEEQHDAIEACKDEETNLEIFRIIARLLVQISVDLSDIYGRLDRLP